MGLRGAILAGLALVAILAWRSGVADVAADRSIAVVPIVREPSFRSSSRNIAIYRGLAAALAKADVRVGDEAVTDWLDPAKPLEAAQAAGVRFVFTATIGADFDNVKVKWQVYDALAEALAAEGVNQADIDNLETLPLEMSSQLTRAMAKPPSEEALCRAGYRRLDTSLRPGGGADNAPVDARNKARLEGDEAFEALGDKTFDTCLPFLDHAFEALGLAAGYAKAAKP